MPRTFRLSICTPEESLFDADVVSLIAPGATGFMGILVDHAPLVSATIPGPITIKDGQLRAVTIQASSKGFLEAYNNQVNILLNSTHE